MVLRFSVLLLLLCLSWRIRAQSQEIPLYEKVPNSTGHVTKDIWTGDYSEVRAVSIPYLTIFSPQQHKLLSSAIIIMPGGNYSCEQYERDGKKIAMELVKQNITVFILRYRLPDASTMRNKCIGPIQDAQQAIQLVRSLAKERLLDPNRIGVMGFSTGAHLAAMAATQFDSLYVPRIAGSSTRPDFMVLISPEISMQSPLACADSRHNLLGDSVSPALLARFSNEEHITEKTPPAYIIYAQDDSIVPTTNSETFYRLLRLRGVDARIEIMPVGGRDFHSILPMELWAQELLSWMHESGWIIDPKPDDTQPQPPVTVPNATNVVIQ